MGSASPSPLRRTARVLGRFWRASISAELEYRTNFVIACITSAGGLVGGVFGLSLFYQRGYAFEGWSFDEALAVLGTFTALTGFNQTFLSPNLSRIVEHVEQGTLDFVLLKPIDSQLWVSTRQLSLWGSPDLLVGCGVIAYSAWRTGSPLGGALAAFGPLLASAVLLYGLWFLLASMSIWFVKVYNATEVLRGLLEAGRFPMSAYPTTFRVFFTFVVPVAFLTTVPAEALLGRGSWTFLGGSVALGGAAFVAARRFWRFALRNYTSASS